MKFFLHLVIIISMIIIRPAVLYTHFFSLNCQVAISTLSKLDTVGGESHRGLVTLTTVPAENVGGDYQEISEGKH